MTKNEADYMFTNPVLRFSIGVSLLLVFGSAACTAEPATNEDIYGTGADRSASALTSSQRRIRAAQIRDSAARRDVRAGWALAGIADAETQMSHCLSELSWACPGPNSADCGGGPVVAGAGDGPCSLRQGGLGMFQFDAGTFEDTLRREGSRVLSVDGNVEAAIDFVVQMVIDSAYISAVSTRAEAIAWLNAVRVENSRFDPWIRTVTHYYNGCAPSFPCFSQRYAHYRDNAVGVWNEMGGTAFWFDGATTPATPAFAAIEVYWSRQPTGEYAFRALAPASTVRVVYRVDGWVVGGATRTDGDNFAASYDFLLEQPERRLTVLGYDAAGTQVALGTALFDVTAGVGVYVKQMGSSLYEIGLERAPSGIASVEVRADGYLLTDSVSGVARSPRNAVRSRFGTLGERRFEIRTYSSSGTLRGSLRRTFTLQ